MMPFKSSSELVGKNLKNKTSLTQRRQHLHIKTTPILQLLAASPFANVGNDVNKRFSVMILEGGNCRAMEHAIADDWAVEILDFVVDFCSFFFSLTLFGIEMTVQYVRAGAEDD